MFRNKAHKQLALLELEHNDLQQQISQLRSLSSELDMTINRAIQHGECIMGVYVTTEGEFTITIKAEAT